MIGFATKLTADRIDRIDSAIERMVEISGDLKSMIAVHESRLSQQEKYSEELYSAVEMRRVEIETKSKEMYAAMKEKDNEILKHIEEMRKEMNEQNEALNMRITRMEKYIWAAVGAVALISWTLPIIGNVSKIFFR